MKKSEEFGRAKRVTSVLGWIVVGIGAYLFKCSGYAEAKEKIAKKAEDKHDEDVGRYVDINGTTVDLDNLDN